MTQSLSFLELDLPKCGERFGVFPCQGCIGENVCSFSNNFNAWTTKFNSAAWIGKHYGDADIQSQMDPFGRHEAWTWKRNGASAYLGVGVSKPASALNYTASAFFKRGTARYVSMIIQNSGFGRSQATFDLLDGVISTPAAVTGPFTNPVATIRAVGNGWFKCSISGVTPAVSGLETYFSGNTTNVTLEATDPNVASTVLVCHYEVYPGAVRDAHQPPRFIPGIEWDFRDGGTLGWAALGTGGSVTGAEGGMLWDLVGGDASLHSPSFSVSGGANPVLRIEVERILPSTSPAANDAIFYAISGGHGHSGSFYKYHNDIFNTGDLLPGERRMLDFYMGALTAGGNDWITNTITSLRFDFDWAGTGGRFRVIRVAIGNYGTLPAVTGEDKCVNTPKTCHDRPNYREEGVTARYTKRGVLYRPDDIEALPFLSAVEYTPGAVSLGDGLGERSGLTATLVDGRWPDTGALGDPYLADRAVDPMTIGSYWGRHRSRHPYVLRREMRWYLGEVGQNLDDMEVHHFLVESVNGPSNDSGIYRITGRDPLKQLDGEHAQFPALNTGFLQANILAAATELTLLPAGVGEGEYAVSGYLNIGNKEIVAFTRPFDYEVILHFDNNLLDATGQHTATAVGNAAPTSAQSVFGGFSLGLDGSGDYVQLDGSPAFTLAGDFEIDFRLRLAAIGGVRKGVFDWTTSTAVNGIWLYFMGSSLSPFNTLRVGIGGSYVINVGVGTALAANTWYHIRVSRVSGTIRLFINGVAEASTAANATTLVVSANRPVIGIEGSLSAGTSLNGWIEEFAVKVGSGTSANFTPPAAAFSGVRGDRFLITRAQFGTEAQDHTAQDLAQQCAQFIAQTPANLLYNVMVTNGPVPAAYVNLTAWQAEVNTYLPGTVFSALIAQPIPIKDIVKELLEHAGCVMWFNDEENTIGLQVLRAVAAGEEFNEENTLAKSITISEQPDKQVTEVWTYYGQKSPLDQLDDPANYRSVAATASLQAESDYGAPRIKKVYSRWIATGGRAIALRLNDIILSRFVDPPRAVSFRLNRGAGMVVLAGGYFLRANSLQDYLGRSLPIPFHVTRRGVGEASTLVEGQEALYTAPATDLSNRLITLDADILNQNLRTLHDNLYGAPGVSDVFTVTLNIEEGVIVGSASTALPALDIGSGWPAGVTVVVNLFGRIQGCGGKGGPPGLQSETLFPGGPGLPGGTALYTRKAILLNRAGGELWSGAGGGGGGTGFTDGPGGEGGGGSGRNPGLGGLNNATDEVGGTGSGAGIHQAANGGGPGLPGNTAPNSVPGGAAGAAIDGVSFVTVGTGPGDVRGGQIN